MNPQLVFFVYVFTSLVSASVIAKLYIWPKLKSLRVEQSLEALIAPQALIRLIGLGFSDPWCCQSLPVAGICGSSGRRRLRHCGTGLDRRGRASCSQQFRQAVGMDIQSSGHG